MITFKDVAKKAIEEGGIFFQERKSGRSRVNYTFAQGDWLNVVQMDKREGAEQILAWLKTDGIKCARNGRKVVFEDLDKRDQVEVDLVQCEYCGKWIQEDRSIPNMDRGSRCADDCTRKGV